jgi:hypothetical protein
MLCMTATQYLHDVRVIEVQKIEIKKKQKNAFFLNFLHVLNQTRVRNGEQRGQRETEGDRERQREIEGGREGQREIKGERREKKDILA